MLTSSAKEKAFSKTISALSRLCSNVWWFLFLFPFPSWTSDLMSELFGGLECLRCSVIKITNKFAHRAQSMKNISMARDLWPGIFLSSSGCRATVSNGVIRFKALFFCKIQKPNAPSVGVTRVL